MQNIKPAILLGFSLLVTLLSSACSAIRISPTETDAAAEAAPTLVFSGKVTVAGEWKNDYMVLLFLDGEEIGRQVTYLGKLEESGEGVHNGLFKIAVPNTYELSTDNFFGNYTNEPVLFENAFGSFDRITYMYTWFGEVIPDQLIRINVPEKQIQYAVKIMPTTIFDTTNPPPPPSQAILDKDGNVNPKTTPGEMPPTVKPEESPKPATPFAPTSSLPANSNQMHTKNVSGSMKQIILVDVDSYDAKIDLSNQETHNQYQNQQARYRSVYNLVPKMWPHLAPPNDGQSDLRSL